LMNLDFSRYSGMERFWPTRARSLFDDMAGGWLGERCKEEEETTSTKQKQQTRAAINHSS
jgi:hypothetical protein